MIPISNTKAKKEENSRVKSKQRSHDVRQKESFGTVLNDRISFEFKGAIDELLNDLKKEEKEFLERQSQYHLRRYKSVVEQLLKKILDEGFETSKLRRLKRDKADFVIVNKINSRLFEITGYITSNNKAFNLLKAVEEIRGLVFDLLY